jgi:hypothetical protein
LGALSFQLPPSLSPSILSAFTPPYPLFEWYPQSKEILVQFQYEMLKLSIYCTRFETNYIVVVQVGAVKIYVAAVKALRKTERGDSSNIYCERKRKIFLEYF